MIESKKLSFQTLIVRPIWKLSWKIILQNSRENSLWRTADVQKHHCNRYVWFRNLIERILCTIYTLNIVYIRYPGHIPWAIVWQLCLQLFFLINFSRPFNFYLILASSILLHLVVINTLFFNSIIMRSMKKFFF